MNAIFVFLLLIAVLRAAVRPAWVVVLLVYLFPIEQVLQTMVPFLRTSTVGGQATNYGAGFLAIVGLFVTGVRKQRVGTPLTTTTALLVTALLSWSIVSLAWSPGRQAGADMVVSRWPYYFVFVVIGPVLVSDFEDLKEFLQGLLLAGVALCAVVLASPEFESQYGRLGIVDAGKLASNPLAIGELGGVTIISGALLSAPVLGRFSTVLRVAAVLLGLAVAIKSGSRGQMLFAVGVATAAYPLVGNVRSLSGFFGTVAVVASLVVASLSLSSVLLEGTAAKRFSLEALLYGSSSTAERSSNVVELARAWASSPFAVLVGLGYFAFSSFGLGIDYSHVVAADALFELGVPGAICYVALLVTILRNSVRLYRVGVGDPCGKCMSGALCALLMYYWLLSNKQGDLWGVMTLFLLAVISERVLRRSALGLCPMLHSDADRFEFSP